MESKYSVILTNPILHSHRNNNKTRARAGCGGAAAESSKIGVQLGEEGEAVGTRRATVDVGRATLARAGLHVMLGRLLLWPGEHSSPPTPACHRRQSLVSVVVILSCGEAKAPVSQKFRNIGN
ncbi:hydroxyproline-rich glycoprotein family protein [Perilla frutescens var. hirtella]|uniref:Hydroxyproline-rich glycoprotein family protein n=1 Tax=Perilla frutescens var. hirtella TaxID=608512 RepID=A0AAD4J9J1_PERFH|nr:hydroxyproline-rich glycoprotein family protein [Perilla frutescens var. hirtella]